MISFMNLDTLNCKLNLKLMMKLQPQLQYVVVVDKINNYHEDSQLTSYLQKMICTRVGIQHPEM